jgi:hypothetical protein
VQLRAIGGRGRSGARTEEEPQHVGRRGGGDLLERAAHRRILGERGRQFEPQRLRVREPPAEVRRARHARALRERDEDGAHLGACGREALRGLLPQHLSDPEPRREPGEEEPDRQESGEDRE